MFKEYNIYTGINVAYLEQHNVFTNSKISIKIWKGVYALLPPLISILLIILICVKIKVSIMDKDRTVNFYSFSCYLQTAEETCTCDKYNYNEVSYTYDNIDNYECKRYFRFIYQEIHKNDDDIFMTSLMVSLVLSPILIIIVIPFFVYIILYEIATLLKSCGYYKYDNVANSILPFVIAYDKKSIIDFKKNKSDYNKNFTNNRLCDIYVLTIVSDML